MARPVLDRRQFNSLAIGAAAAGFVGSAGAAPRASVWDMISPADAGLDTGVVDRLDKGVGDGSLPNLHAVAVVRRGKLVFDRYYEGLDEFWAMPLGKVKFGPTVKHDMRSATKSMVGLLYGIALHEGKVPSLDAVLIDQFPEYADLATDPMRRRMKVSHILSMTAGFEWPEDIPYTDAQNPELAMYLATDQFRYVLEHPMVTEPGSAWNYNGGTTAIAGRLIGQGTRMPIFHYARQRLFDPLGITEVQWVGGTNGEVSSPSGLRMPARELAKIGKMVLNKGVWEGRQVVPASWIEQCLTPHAKVPGERMGPGTQIEYGYQWWIVNHKSKHPIFAARGNGGQALMIIPSLDLIVVVMAGNYNSKSKIDVPNAVINDYILPALEVT